MSNKIPVWTYQVNGTNEIKQCKRCCRLGLGFADVAGGGVSQFSQRVRQLSGAPGKVGAAQFAVRVQLSYHGSPHALQAVGPGKRALQL